MIAKAHFTDPSDVKISIHLHGTLKEFEDLSAEMLEEVNYSQARPIIEAVREATDRLRAITEGGRSEQAA